FGPIQVGQPLPDGGVSMPWINLFNAASNFYGNYDGFREAIQAAITLPADVTLDALLASPYLYQDDARIALDQAKLMAALKENVIDPMIETQKLLISRPYLTRLFTTLSADEMTVDPLFSTNTDLADVSNRHTAEQVIECSESVYQYDAPWRIELPQGGVIRGVGSNNTWPYMPTDHSMPANRKIVDLSESGAGDVVVDNSEAIWHTLHVTQVVPNPMTGTGSGSGVPIGGYDAMVPASTNASSKSGGCSAVGVTTRSTGFGLLALLALFVVQRRRRQTA
ncbi:MAG TPA: MYXO-CTERM sorting domain-containing protein, partial [Polyangiaceae bacterium]|nr:MYXO-CTERM sorting domain-containing protein [Polyangiaceae bacterium]